MKPLKDPKINFSGRGIRYTDGEIQAVVQAMRDADPLTQGRYQEEFEARFSDYLGVKAAFAVTSCTAALELAATLTGIGPGDEVIIPAHTFCSSAIPFARRGANLVWADIDLETRLITAATIRPLLTKKTKIIVVVHLYGLVADMDAILDLAGEYGIKVVEDVAHAVGGAYKGRKAGTLGDYGCFSFHSHKNISTLGEGGMIVVKDPGDMALVPSLRHNGHCDFTQDRDYYWQPAMGNLDFAVDGVWPFNFCLGEVQCALGSKLLERLDEINSDRRSRAEYLKAKLTPLDIFAFQKEPDGCEHIHHLFAARFLGEKYGIKRDEFMAELAFTHGIKVVVQYCPLYRYPLFKRSGFGNANTPNSDTFFDNMISFPFMPWMSREELDSMVEAVEKTFKSLSH